MLTVFSAPPPAAIQSASVAPLSLSVAGSPLNIGAVGAGALLDVSEASAQSFTAAASVSTPFSSVSALTINVVAAASDVGPPGPTGPAGAIGQTGPKGPPGAGIFYTVPFTGVASGQTITLPSNIGTLSMLVIEGVVESPTNYSIGAATLGIPPGLVWDGANCQFVFCAPSTVGAGGDSGYIPVIEEFTVTMNNETFTTSQSIGAPVEVFVNGLRQNPESFAVSGAEFTLASGVANAGDSCLIEFTPTT